MKILILISTLFLVPGCLFLDSSQTCDTCVENTVIGKFVVYQENCLNDTATVCSMGNCGPPIFVQCQQSIKLSLTNQGFETAIISEPDVINLYSPAGKYLLTVDIDELYRSDYSDAQTATRTADFERVLKLESGESVNLTLSFVVSKPMSAAANINFPSEGQDDIYSCVPNPLIPRPLLLPANLVRFSSQLFDSSI